MFKNGRIMLFFYAYFCPVINIKEMKKLNYYVALVCAVAGLISCNNDLIDSADYNNQESVVNTKSLDIVPSDTIIQTCKFLYQGVDYETTMQLVNDSIVLIENQTVEQLLADLNDLPNLVTYQHRDGTIEYFDNRDALMSVLPNIVAKEEKETSSPHATPRDWWSTGNPVCDPVPDGNTANLFLCDDDNYSGKVRHIFLPIGQQSVVVNHLKPDLNMNDKTTSFVAYCFNGSTFFELYENDDLASNCLSFTCYDSGTPQKINTWGYQDKMSRAVWPPVSCGQVVAPDLKNVHVAGTKKSSWNDRITSVRITKL